MNKIFCYTILTIIGLILLTPVVALANNPDSVQIVSSGGITDGIGNFTVSLDSFDEEANEIVTTGTWTLPATVEYVHIRRDFNNYPINITSGTEVYEGALETFNETITEIPNNIFYSAWTYSNTTSWSSPVNYTLEVSSIMGTQGISEAMYLGVFVFIALGAGIAFFATKQGLLAIVSAFGWLISGIYSYGQYETAWDINYSIAFFSMFMALLFVIASSMFYYNKRKDRMVSSDEEDWGDQEPLRQAILQQEEDTRRMEMALGGSTKRTPKLQRIVTKKLK